MGRVLRQGTFDVLHPGHLHYLRESAALGDELVVIIARDARVSERKDLLMDEESRRMVVEALEMVDRAVLGSTDSIFDSVRRFEPAVITLGYDQQFDEAQLAADLAGAGFPDVEVVRIGPYRGAGPRSSSEVKARLKEHAGPDAFHSLSDPDG